MENQINKINLKAPGNWINDPNGFIYFEGKYHLFYQYFPYAPFWGTMHWGHAISDDLINWKHLGIALFPTKAYDRNGIFSGSAIEKDGKMYLYYTGMVYDREREENIHLSVGYDGFQSQAMLISDDGKTFDNFNGKKQIIPPIENKDIADPHDCRDPKVWKEGNQYFMCVASTKNRERGVLLLFKSDDAVNWTYFNRFESEVLGTILECPDLFKIEDQWMLVCSPIGVMKESDCYENQAVIQPVTFNAESGEVNIQGKSQFLDYGFDLYAPQSNLDEDGKRVVISWVRMESPMKPDHNTASAGKIWNGMMAIPRVMELRDGVIYTCPHPNIQKLFDSIDAVKISGMEKAVYENSFRLKTVLSEGQWIDIEGYKIGLVDGCVVGDRSDIVPQEIKVHKKSNTPYVGNSCSLEIYCDPDLIEIFVNDGLYVLSHVTYGNSYLK